MLQFRLVALDSTEATTDALAALELASFFTGEAKPTNLPIDIDCAREWYMKNIIAEIDRDDYDYEPQMVDDELIDSFSKSLLMMVKQRVIELGDHYPFAVNESNQLVTRSSKSVSVVGACYLSLQFFRGLTGGTIEICDENGESVREYREKFDREFRKVFEFIAGYTVAGIRDGAPYMISDCRSYKRLEALLKSICRKVGSGRVHPVEVWNQVQLNAHDAGVDCLVHLGGPGTPGHAEILLIGATVQSKQRIEGKIIGQEKLNFFGSFFAQKPAAFRGVLVRPMDEDEYIRIQCAGKDCLLFSYDEIWRGIGKRTGDCYQMNALRRLDAKVRRLLRTFLGAKFLDDYAVYELEV